MTESVISFFMRRFDDDCMNSLRACWCYLLILVATGCGTAATTSITPPMTPDTIADQATADEVTADEATAPGEVVGTGRSPSSEHEGLWDAFYIEESKVGHGRTIVEPIDEDGRAVIKTTSENVLKLKRFGRSIEQHISLESIETPDGEVIRFRSEMLAGSSPVVTSGQVVDGRMNITMSTQGKSVSRDLDWAPDWGGFFATEQTLERKPMQPGEVRTLTSLVPVFTQSAEVTLEAIDYESTQLLTEVRELLRIRSTVRLSDDNQIESFFWTDRHGRTLKSHVPGINQYGYRTTRELALDDGGTSTFDLGDHTIVPVARRLARPHDTRQIVYRVHLNNGDPHAVFPSGPTQSVRSLDDTTAEITVRAIRATEPADLAIDEGSQPVAADRNANNLVQSDDPRIVAMAAGVAPDETDAWRLAQYLEQYVRRQIRAKNFSQAFATAAEVAETLEGDCTEHSVLLAALCRAREIPARVAMGLVYYEAKRGYAYHMWNEVWSGDRWVPLDATLGRGGIGAAHLKLGDSNLDGATAYSAFLPVFRVMGQLQIELVEVE